MPGGNDSFTKLLLHCDGADGSTTFINGAAGGTAAVTAAGAAQVDTAQSVFGGASALFDGVSGTYLSVADSADWAYGTDPFVVDFRGRFPAVGGGTERTLLFQGSDVNNLIQFNLGTDGTLGFLVISGGGVVASYTTTTAPSINTWYHIAFVRSGTSFFIFLDGVSQSLSTFTAIGSSSIPNFAAALTIGDNLVAPSLPCAAHFDEIRISKGTDRGWTTNFTPQADAYGHELAAASRSYALTGVAAPLVPAMAEGAGAFSLAGVAAQQIDGVVAGLGAYALSGIAAPLDQPMAVGAGAYALAGQRAIFHPDSHVTSTDILHKPVDYALGGGVPVRRGRLRL